MKGGWYFGYVPAWVAKHYGEGNKGFREPRYGTVIEGGIPRRGRVKGKYYEYCRVVIISSHTHDNAIVKRKIR